jgi:hypothetical protein
MDAHIEIDADDSTVATGAAVYLDYGQDYRARIWAFNGLGSSYFCEVTFDMNP